MNRRVSVSVAVCVVFAAFGGRAEASIVSTTGDIQVLPSPPPFTAPGQLTSDTLAFAFAEAQDLRLPKDLAVDIGSPLTEGTWVSSYLLHTDVVDEATAKYFTGSITFDTDILAVMYLNNQLEDSDDILGVPTTTYALGGNRRMELDEGDALAISSDGRTLSFTFKIRHYRDECRVVTASTVPEPSAFAAWTGLLGIGIVGGWWRRRRREVVGA